MPISSYSVFSIHRFRRIKGSNIIQEVNPDDRSHSVCKTTSNYDMTILHEDELNSTQLATIRRRKKKIPHWAKKDQLQLAIINQIYFQDQNPEDIFGDFCIDQALTMIHSIPLCNKVPTSTIVPRHFL
ncbi:hypothetical protein I4U23_021502 [Adineta vaga]|nr:hypothetical protein I4U23_021502 [Adineta vaga]